MVAFLQSFVNDFWRKIMIAAEGICPVLPIRETASPIFLPGFLQQQVETEAYLASLPEHLRRIAEKLLMFGFSLKDIQEGLRHPKFPVYMSQILSTLLAGKISQEEAVAGIRRILDRISKLSREEIEESQRPHIEESQKPSPKEEKKERKKEKTEARKPNNDTLRRLSILAGLWDGAGVTIKEQANLTGLSERRLHDALHDLEKAGLVGKFKKGRSYYYFLTHAGVVYLERKLKLTFRQSQLPEPFGKGLCRNVRDSLLELLQQAQSITRELASMGWWHRCIRDAFFQHDLEYIASWIERIKNNPQIEDPGAYSWSVLMGRIPDEKRRDAMARRILDGLDKDLAEVYKDEAANNMSNRQALRFALAVRSMWRKCQTREGWTFTVGDVRGIAGWCRDKTPA